MKKIKVLCYGEIEEYSSRADAIKFYMECAYCSEGSERERYMNVIMDLLERKDFCTDRAK